MLGRSFTTVLPLAQELAENGIVLHAVPSSILSELCSLSAPVQFQSAEKNFPKSFTELNDISTYSMMLDWSTHGDSGQLWGSSFDNSVESIASLLSNQISYIRNVVSPRVGEFIKDSQLFIQELGLSNPASELEIERFSIPEFVQDSAFLVLLENFKNKSPVKPNSYSLSFNVKELPSDNFMSVASTSNARLDAMIYNWAQKCDKNILKEVWYAFFAGSNYTKTYGSSVSDIDLKSSNLSVRLNTSIAYFLIANFYNNHLPDMVSDESTAAIKRRIFDHLSFAGASLSRALQIVEQSNKNDTIVYYVDKEHKKIIVSAENYDKWLMSGGSADVIMGNLVGEKHYYTAKDIDANSKTLLQIWKNYTVIYVQSIEYRKAATLRSFYKSLFAKYLTTDYSEPLEIAFRNSNTLLTNQIVKTADTLIDKLTKDKLENTALVAKELIAGVKYNFTYAKKFLDDMESVANVSKDVLPEESAMAATLNYIVDYLQSQIRAIKF